MNLPPILRDPLVAVVGEQCYSSLVENLNVSDVDCIKHTISKGLGYAIVLGGSVVKIPQILTIMKNRSAQGLSLSSYGLETLSYGIVLAYNQRQGNPFSTFGEIFFITLQNVFIASLILHYGGRKSLLVLPITGFVALLYSLTNPQLVSSSLMATLYAVTIPLSLASKVPQIMANYSNKSTGQLSVFTVLNYFLGSVARVFTTMTELNDPLMLGGNLLASTLNLVLLLQVVMYWGKKTIKKD